MVNRPHIPRALKLCAINLYNRGLLDLDDILDCVGFSESTFYRALACWRATGDVVSPKSGSLVGRPRLLLHDDVKYLLCLVQHRPDYFLDELNDLLKENRFISVHYSTIIRELGRCGISVKKLRRIALECCPDKRAAYIARIGQYSPEQLGFIDETSKDDRTPARCYGRSKKGRKAQKRQRFVRGKRLTATGLLMMDGMMASRVVQGSMDGEMFCSFLEEEVVRSIGLTYICHFLMPWTFVSSSYHCVHHSLESWVSLYWTMPRSIIAMKSKILWPLMVCRQLDWLMYCPKLLLLRCLSHLFVAILPWLQPYWRGFCKDQGISATWKCVLSVFC